MNETDYTMGRRAAALSILQSILDDLDADTMDAALLLRELADTRQQLRHLSEELGCNDWDDDLYLADVVEKYVSRATLETKCYGCGRSAFPNS